MGKSGAEREWGKVAGAAKLKAAKVISEGKGRDLGGVDGPPLVLHVGRHLPRFVLVAVRKHKMGSHFKIF